MRTANEPRWPCCVMRRRLRLTPRCARRLAAAFAGLAVCLSIAACRVGSLDDVEPDAPLSETRPPAPVDDANDLRNYVAQCEAVLGPIPAMSCDPAKPAPGTRVAKIPVFVRGRLLAFDDPPPPEDQVIMAQRAASGRYTCDFPSLGGDFPCAVGSTLVQSSSPDNPNVQWVGLCRGVERDNPSYDRFVGSGLIGANAATGEMCFFFGVNPAPEAAYDLPPLTSAAPSGDALSPWLPPRDMPGSCLSCHPNNDPWILTPWLMPGYMRGVLAGPDYSLQLPVGVALDEVLAARIIDPTPAELQLMHPPSLPEGRTAWTEEEILDASGRVLRRQYRAVGSSYVQNEALGLVKPRTGLQPESWRVDFRERLRVQPAGTACSAPCHLTGNEHWQALALDALGVARYSHHMSADRALGELVWMPAAAGAASLGGQDSYTVKAISECPIPRALSEPPKARIRCGDRGATVDLEWTYASTFGGVPDRDDIRFDVAMDPHGDAALGLGLSPASPLEGVAMDESPGRVVVRDVAASRDGTYRIASALAPGLTAGSLWIAVQPKRYCFEEPDRRPFAYAPPATLEVEIDVDDSCD